MKIRRVDDLAEGIERLVPLLSKEPILYAQLLGVLARLKMTPSAFGEAKPLLWLVEQTDGQLLGGALRTPPFPLQFSVMDDTVLQALGRRVLEDDPECPGVIGLAPKVQLLAHSMEPADSPAKTRLHMTLYGLIELKVKPKGGLTYRKAELNDFDLVSRWMHRFIIDCDLPERPLPEKRLREELETGRIDLGLNEDGEPVLMFKAIVIEDTRILRIGAVYTPDEHRGRGYATEGLADAIDRKLGVEIEVVTLFADKNNPVSNRMYLNLGFVRSADVLMMNWREST